METDLVNVARCLREHAPVFYLVVDAQGVVRESNPFTVRLLGGEVTGKLFREVFVDFRGALDLAALARDPAAVHQLEVSTTAGLPQTIQCGCHPVGDLVLVLGRVDVTEMQTLQRQFIGLNNELNVVTRQLQKANVQLQKLNELKNRFVGFAAHDLRRPVGVIQTYTEFLQDEARDRLSAEHAEFLDIIHGRARSMLQLIEELLDIAMIESGRNDPKLQTADLASIFQVACLTVKTTAAAKQVAVLSTVDPAVPRLELDPLKIEQATLNLLANAVEHTQPGTTVRLNARREGESVVVSVTDQGPGIPPAMLDKLFQPFARGQAQKAGGHDSHGLGLAIAKRMVEAHHGRIWAESPPGAGATFSFTLPLQITPLATESTPL